jgi:hypothetical protein
MSAHHKISVKDGLGDLLIEFDDPAKATDKDFYLYFKDLVKKQLDKKVKDTFKITKDFIYDICFSYSNSEGEKVLIKEDIKKEEIINAHSTVEAVIPYIREDAKEDGKDPKLETKQASINNIYSQNISELIHNLYPDYTNSLAASHAFYVNGQLVDPESRLYQYDFQGKYTFVRANFIHIQIWRNNEKIYPCQPEKESLAAMKPYLKRIDDNMTVYDIAKRQYMDRADQEEETWKNVSYQINNKILKSKDKIAKYVHVGDNNNILLECLQVKIDIIDHEVPLKYQETLKELRQDLLNEIKLVNDFPTYVYPFMDTAEFYYKHESSTIQLKDEEPIFNKLTTKSNVLYTKFRVCILADITKEINIKVFGTSDIYGTISEKLKLQKEIYLFNMKETEVKDNETSQDISFAQYQFNEIKKGSKFSDEKIFNNPFVHMSYEKAFLDFLMKEHNSTIKA